MGSSHLLQGRHQVAGGGRSGDEHALGLQVLLQALHGVSSTATKIGTQKTAGPHEVRRASVCWFSTQTPLSRPLGRLLGALVLLVGADMQLVVH
jgi:hypothetical protein